MAVISGRRKRMNTKYSSGLTRPKIQMIAMITRGITQGWGRRNVEIRKQTTKTSLERGSRRWRNEAPAEDSERRFMRTSAGGWGRVLRARGLAGGPDRAPVRDPRR